MPRLNTHQTGTVFEWALMMDGEVVQLFKSQAEALSAWRIWRKRKGRITELTVEKIKGLFDAA